MADELVVVVLVSLVPSVVPILVMFLGLWAPGGGDVRKINNL